MFSCIEEDETTSTEFAFLMKQHSACVEQSTGTTAIYGGVEVEYGHDSSKVNL
jgi:hypothetical protein